MKYNVYKIMFHFIRQRWIYVLGIFLSGIAIVVSTVYIPLFLGECYQVFENNTFTYIPFLLLAGGYIVRAVFKLVRNQLAAGLGTNVTREMRTFYVESYRNILLYMLIVCFLMTLNP